jgi:hypothetical protein
MHSYPFQSGGLPSSFGTWITNWNNLVTPKKIAVTETGYHNCVPCPTNGVSRLAHRKYIPRIYGEYWRAGIVRTMIYELMDEGPDSTVTREDNWGLVKHNGEIKPAFTALKNLISILNDFGPSFSTTRLDFTLTDALATTHWILLQKRDLSTFYWLAWREVSSWNASQKIDINNAGDALTFNVATPATSFKVYHPWQGTNVVQVGSGSNITLSVPDEIIVLEIKY